MTETLASIGIVADSGTTIVLRLYGSHGPVVLRADGHGPLQHAPSGGHPCAECSDTYRPWWRVAL